MGDDKNPYTSYNTENEDKDCIFSKTEEFMKLTAVQNNLETTENVKQKIKGKRILKKICYLTIYCHLSKNNLSAFQIIEEVCYRWY